MARNGKAPDDEWWKKDGLEMDWSRSTCHGRLASGRLRERTLPCRS